MNKSLFALMALTLSAAACSSPTPSLSAVIPDHAYEGVPVDVTIAGYGTAWTTLTPPTVSFGGSDITINSTVVASPTSLVVNITPSTSATTGARNVTVTDTKAKLTLTYSGAFSVLANDGSIPSVSALSPRSTFLLRTLDVLISGSNTTWGGTTTADFGPGITVNTLTVASQTALLANITVAATAPTGLRTVTVASGSSSVAFTNAFEVANPTTMSTQGNLAQGSIFFVSFFNQDPTTPFDTTAEEGLFSNTYTNINFTLAGGGALPSSVNMSVENVTNNEVDVEVLADVMAPSGALDMVMVSGPVGGTDVSYPVTVSIAQQTATALTGTAVSTTTGPSPYWSTLYSAAVPAPSAAGQGWITEINATSSSGSAIPVIFLLPSSGAFADTLYSQPDVLLGDTGTNNYYAMYLDESGTPSTPYTIQMTQTSVPVTVLPATPKNTTPSTATKVTSLPALLTNAVLPSQAADTDVACAQATDCTAVDTCDPVAGKCVPIQSNFYTVGITTADVTAMRAIRVVLYGTDTATDAAVDVGTFDSEGNWTSLLGGVNDIGGLPSDTVTPPVPSYGIYTVWIQAGASFSSTDASYNVIIQAEAGLPATQVGGIDF